MKYIFYLSILQILLCFNVFGENKDRKNEVGVSCEVDYWVVLRDKLQNIQLFYNMTSDGTYIPIIDNLNKKTNFDITNGVKVKANFNPNTQVGLEILFSGLLHWHLFKRYNNVDQIATTPTIILNPYSTNDWSQFNTIGYKNKSYFNSYEISCWNHLSPRYIDYFAFSVMCGGRAIYFKDNMLLQNINAGRTNDFTMDVKNFPIGVQLGFDFQNTPYDRFTWAILVKGGLYANFIEKNLELKDNGNTTIIENKSIDKVETLFSIDVNPYITLNLLPFYINLGFEWLNLFNTEFAIYQVNKYIKIDQIKKSNRHLQLFSGYIGLGAHF